MHKIHWRTCWSLCTNRISSTRESNHVDARPHAAALTMHARTRVPRATPRALATASVRMPQERCRRILSGMFSSIATSF